MYKQRIDMNDILQSNVESDTTEQHIWEHKNSALNSFSVLTVLWIIWLGNYFWDLALFLFEKSK